MLNSCSAFKLKVNSRPFNPPFKDLIVSGKRSSIDCPSSLPGGRKGELVEQLKSHDVLIHYC